MHEAILTNPDVPAITKHAAYRASQRNFKNHEIAYVLKHGRLERRTGIRFYFLAAIDIPRSDSRNENVLRLVGATILVAEDGSSIISMYKNPNALRDIKKKAKRRRHS